MLLIDVIQSWCLGGNNFLFSIIVLLGYDGMIDRGIGDMKMIRALKPEEEELINRYLQSHNNLYT